MTNDHDDHDFRQLAGRFNQPVAPSPTFTAELLKHGRETTLIGRTNAKTMSHIELSRTLATTIAASDDPITIRWRVPAWIGIAQSAAAVLLVLSLVVVSVYFQKPAALFQQGVPTTPIEDSARTLVNYAGDPGRSWTTNEFNPSVGDNAPNGEFLRMGLGTDLNQQLSSPGLIVGDRYLYSVTDGSGTRVVCYDLQTSEEMWTSSILLHGAWASDGKLLFGFAMNGFGVNPFPVPTAIDLETGLLAWQGPPLVLGSDGWGSGPILTKNQVLFTDSLGNTIALKPSDGTRIWQYPDTFHPLNDYEDGEPTEIPYIPTGEIVVSGNAAFVELASMTIVKLNLDTGEPMDRFNVLDEYGTDIESVSLQANDEYLLVTAKRSERLVLGGDAEPYRPTTFLTFDQRSLELVSRSGLPWVFSNAVLSGQGAYVLGTTSSQERGRVLQIELDSGEIIDPEIGVGASNTWAGLSLAGSTLMAVIPEAPQVFFHDVTTGESTSRNLPNDIENTVYYGPVVTWGSTPVVVSSGAEIVLLLGK